MVQNPYDLAHSLEMYEQYATVRCRPVCIGAEKAEPYQVYRPRWADLAPEKGVFHFEQLTKADSPKGTVLLNVDLTAPMWARDAEDAAQFIRLLGAALLGGAAYAGVLVDLSSSAEAARPALLRAWMAGFDHAALIVRSTDTVTMEIMKHEGTPFGVLLDVSGGILLAREAMAMNHLQRIWETSPILLETEGCPDTPDAIRKAAALWHALGADRAGLLPGKLALRRLTYPKEVTTGGALPLRFWWQVMGDSPIYGQTSVVAKLIGAEGEAMLGIEDKKSIRLPGDAAHNQIVTLPDLPVGEYTLFIGVQGPDARILKLSMEAPMKDGLYEIGTVNLSSTPRPELFAAWEHYYPEGYYPLEDPKLPY